MPINFILACGNLKNRTTILRLLGALPQVTLPSQDEAMFFLEQNNLMGRGIGYIELHLLAATALTHHARLWTLDRRLAMAAENLGLTWIFHKSDSGLRTSN